ncbi:TlpA family protein disulfide reductase [Rohdeia mirabilis]
MNALLTLAVACPHTDSSAPVGQEESGDVPAEEPATELESWRFELDLGPRGDAADGPRDVLPFLVEYDAPSACAFVVNGSERIAVPNSPRGWERWNLDFPHYDSTIELRRELGEGEHVEWRGTWTKVRGAGEPAVVPVRAVADPVGRFASANGLSIAPQAVAGRWRVGFESGGDLPAVALLEAGAGTEVFGTILTDTGDYRFLAGDLSSRGLRLSCFDGAHAFLFEARVEIDPVAGDRLVDGVFRSGDWWSEGWTAVRDDAVELPDPFGRLGLRPTAHLEFLALPDASGAWHPLWTPGRPAVIEVFGSWCPNCHDAARLLEELDDRHGDVLDVVGVAFELTGEWERDARQVERFRERHDLGYRLLVGGTANKADTARALGLTDEILSYPTTFFVDANGTITAIYSGFSGPATGAAHLKLREAVEREVASIVAPDTSRGPRLDDMLADTAWRMHGVRSSLRGTARGRSFGRSGGVLVSRSSPSPAPPAVDAVSLLRVAGRTVEYRVQAEMFGQHLAARSVYSAGRLVEGGDLRVRWTQEGSAGGPTELIAEQCEPALELDDATLRAEGAWAAGHFGLRALQPQLVALLSDRDTWVRANAAAASAALGDRRAHDRVELAPDGLAALDAALRTAATDPSHLVRREAARALAAWGLGPDLLASWQASPSPFDRELARLYAAELAVR